jgi:hypothetical protein
MWERDMTPDNSSGSEPTPAVTGDRGVDATHGWTLSVFESLLEGSSEHDASQKATQAGADPRAAHEFVRSLAKHPQMRRVRADLVRLRSRDWLLGVYSSLERHDPRGAYEQRDSVTKSQFLDEFYYRNRALYLPRVALNWPAVTKWNREYLSDVCGDIQVEVMMNRLDAQPSDQNVSDQLRRQVPFRDYVRMVYEDGPSNDRYLVSRNRFFEQPGTEPLLEDLRELPFVRTQARDGSLKMWFGPGGTITPLHHDDRNNVIVQIMGSKQVRLYPAACAPLMAQVRSWFAGSDPGSNAPEIRVTLTAGDALFIPAGWWHALEAEAISITLAMVDFGVPNEYGYP